MDARNQGDARSDELRPASPLFPSDADHRRAVEESEPFGDDEFQPTARLRLVAAVMYGGAPIGRGLRAFGERGLVYHRHMADVYRRHAVMEAPIEDVWAIVRDPRTHPDWWPEVSEVRAAGELTEGSEYARTSRRLGFLDQVDGIWVVERLEHMKEAHFRCTVSGSYTRFALTPAQGETFVEVEAGMLPTSLRWRLAKTLSRLYYVRWLRDVLDALPSVVARARRPS